MKVVKEILCLVSVHGMKTAWDGGEAWESSQVQVQDQIRDKKTLLPATTVSLTFGLEICNNSVIC